MKKTITLILAVLLIAGLIGGCASAPQSSSGGSSSQSSSANPDKKNVMGICMGKLNHPVHRIVQAGFITAGTERGYEAQIVGLEDASQQELIAKYESAITNGMTGAAVWVGDNAMYSFMKNYAEDCFFVVPHFAHEYHETKEFIQRNVTALPAKYGRVAADFILEKLAEKGITSGSIAVTQSSGNATENAVNDAFRDEIAKKNTAFKIVPTVFEGLEITEATNKITGIINSNINTLVGALGTTGGSAQAWAAAMENTGKTDIVVVGMDYIEINIDLVSEGKIAGVVAQPLYEEAEICAQTLADCFEGKRFNESEEDWFCELDAPIAYAGGSGTSDIESYRPIIREVIDYWTNRDGGDEY